MQSESLKTTEAECAAGRTAPRVSLADIEGAIGSVFYITGDASMLIGLSALKTDEDRKAYTEKMEFALPHLRLLTLCLITLKNGFTVVGKSAPASAANFDAELGKKLAYEDAVRHIWPLMGFALCDRRYRNPNMEITTP